jgi:hypothetical protein
LNYSALKKLSAGCRNRGELAKQMILAWEAVQEMSLLGKSWFKNSAESKIRHYGLKCFEVYSELD